jgi:FMN phosphatase YigB (HAD superfamily)
MLTQVIRRSAILIRTTRTTPFNRNHHFNYASTAKYSTTSSSSLASGLSINIQCQNTFSQVRAVFFDANGVLYYKPTRGVDKVVALRQWLAHHHHAKPTTTRNSYDISPEDIELQLEPVKTHVSRGQQSLQSYYDAILDLHQVSHSATRAKASEFLRIIDGTVKLYPNVATTLVQLRAYGFHLGVITNTMVDQKTKLDWFSDAGLLFRWDAFVTSTETKAKKPDPEIYQVLHTLTHTLSLSLARSCHVCQVD